MSALYKDVFKIPFLKLKRKAKDYISTDECFNPEVQQKTKSISMRLGSITATGNGALLSSIQ